MDKRDDIIDEVLKKEGWNMEGDRHIYKCCMDTYMRTTCLELLEYMAKNNIECGICKDGPFFLQKKNMQYKAYTKEELFNNFL